MAGKVTMEKFEEEVKLAQKFLEKHKDDKDLIQFLAAVRASNDIHSQKWSMVFDYMYEHYKKECMETSITTGLSYLVG